MMTKGRLLTVFLSIIMVACEPDGDCESVSLNPLSGCSSLSPEAKAGPDQYVVEGDSVELANYGWPWVGMSSKWVQLSGPPVLITVLTGSRVTFTAPSVDVPTTLEFRLTAKLSGKRNRDGVLVHVEPTNETALCTDAPLFATTFVWAKNGCTTDSAKIPDDTRVATLFRQHEAETNGVKETANALQFPGAIEGEPVATSVAGTISSTSGDASDFFVFTPSVQGDYQISLCNDPVACIRGTVTNDRNLVVYDQSNNRVANTNPGALYERQLMVLLNAGSTYYVAILSDAADRNEWKYNLTIMQK